MTVEGIKQIQQQLKDLGLYLGQIDGELGQKTKKAVMKFQENNGLSKDGIINEETLVALNNKSCQRRRNQCIGGTH